MLLNLITYEASYIVEKASKKRTMRTNLVLSLYNLKHYETLMYFLSFINENLGNYAFLDFYNTFTNINNKQRSLLEIITADLRRLKTEGNQNSEMIPVLENLKYFCETLLGEAEENVHDYIAELEQIKEFCEKLLEKAKESINTNLPSQNQTTSKQSMQPINYTNTRLTQESYYPYLNPQTTPNQNVQLIFYTNTGLAQQPYLPYLKPHPYQTIPYQSGQPIFYTNAAGYAQQPYVPYSNTHHYQTTPNTNFNNVTLYQAINGTQNTYSFF
jgi:hypothetical protein